MIKSIVPGYYLFHSRLKTNIEKFSWFIIYFIPIYLLGLYYTPDSYLIYTLFFSLAMLIYNSIYELGYMENDTKTIVKEKNPTIRLNDKEFMFFDEEYLFIVFSKILIACLLLLLVKILSNIFTVDVYAINFMLALLLIRILFYLHNNIRSRVNIFTFFSLSITKYSVPLLLILPLHDYLEVWVISFFLFPFVRTIEHATKVKYGVKKLIVFVGDHDLFRVKYYGIMSIMAFVLWFAIPNDLTLLGFLLMVYFLFYRIGAYILVKNECYNRVNPRVD